MHIVNSVCLKFGTVGSLEAAQVPSARLAFESVQKRPQNDCVVDQNSDIKLILNMCEKKTFEQGRRKGLVSCQRTKDDLKATVIFKLCNTGVSNRCLLKFKGTI